jgi:hypothetical protein
MEIWALVAAVATGAVRDMRLRLLVTVIATIDREAGALERGTPRRPPEALSRGGRQQPVECRDAILIAPSQGTSARVIMARLGLHPRGDEAQRRLVPTTPGHAGALRVHTDKPVEDQRVDGAAPSDQAGLWGVVLGAVKHLTAAPFVNQPGHETEMVQDCTPVRSVPRRLLSKGDSTHPP